MKPFDIKEAKAGKPVCTRDGRDVRIICWDKQSTFPIVGLVGEEEEICTFQISGKYIDTLENYDLFMKEEPTLDDYTTIKTYEDACKALSIGPIVNKLGLVKVVGNEQILLPKHIIALMKLETISKALRNGKKDDDIDEPYLPTFDDYTNCDGASFNGRIARLYQDNEEKAEYFGRQFNNLWEEYLQK